MNPMEDGRETMAVELNCDFFLNESDEEIVSTKTSTSKLVNSQKIWRSSGIFMFFEGPFEGGDNSANLGNSAFAKSFQ